MILNRDQILAAADLPRELVAVPEWDDADDAEVWVRCMNASDRDRFEAAATKDPGRDIRARLAVATICDEDGQALFTEADIPAVGRKSAAALDRIFVVAARLSRIARADVQELNEGSTDG